MNFLILRKRLSKISMSRTRFILLLTSALALAGCRATPPTHLENKVAYFTKRHVTIGGKRDSNPIKDSEDNIEEGQEVFTSYCAVCHGNDGQNTGVPFAKELSPPVPSLASEDVQQYTDGQLNWIIKNGIYPSGMPPSDGDFSSKEIWQMVLYIRHLPKAGSVGIPKVYGGSSK
jgi:mono/diheme cytochrome c family protein